MAKLMENPDEVTVITIKRKGSDVFTDIDHVDKFKPVDPQAIVGACAGVITEYNKYLVSNVELED